MSASDRRPGADPAGARGGGRRSAGRVAPDLRESAGRAAPDLRESPERAVLDVPDPAERVAPDLRLAPLVMALWMGEVVTLLILPAHPGPWVLGGALVVIAAIIGAGAARRRPAQPAGLPRRTGLARVPLVGTPRKRTALLVGLCGLGLGVALAGAHLLRLHPPVLQTAAQRGAVLQAEATITGDPVVRIPADDGGRPVAPSWSVPARLTAVAVRGRIYSVRVPVLLRGDEVAQLRYGSRVALSGRAQESWTPEARSLSLTVLRGVHIRSPPGPAARATTRIREAFRAACAGLPADAGALLLGLAVGDESTLPADLDEAMVRAGLAHLTAVSGSNTSLVVAIAMAAVAGLGLGWRVRVTACLLVLAAYVMLVRPQPSVLRAAAMGVVALVALSTGGRRRGPPALLAAALVLLVVLPQFAVSLGFALSFAATAGLLLVGPPIADRLGRWPVSRRAPEPLRAALAVAAAAHLATLPLAVLMGNGASLVALPANVIVTPLVPIATVLGLAAALVAPWTPAGAALLATVAAPATATIAWVARVAADLPLGVVAVPAGPVGALGSCVLLALLVAAAARGWRPWRDRRVVLAAALAGALGVVLTHVRVDGWPPPDWVVLACDVGQGDGLLLRAPGSVEALLVDAGPDPDRIVDCLRDAGVERLAVLITHFHADHIDGLSEVLGRWPVSGVLTTPVPEPPEGAELVVDTARAAGVPVRLVRAGDRVVVAGVGLDILWPARRMDQSPANNSSVVAIAEVATPQGIVRALLTGDIEPEVQSVLMAGPPPGAHVVKVPHHGSRYQVPQFARWSGARIALFTVGADNDYGHPSPATLQQYLGVGARIGRTDQQGGLAVVPIVGGVALVVSR